MCLFFIYFFVENNTMKKYDFIFLSISSDDLPCYRIMRNVARKYFSLYEDKIKIFFIEFKKDMECDICEKDDYIYVKGEEWEECINPGIYIKTIKSMEYINKTYDYDFLIRTNLSSFWNLNKLLELKPLLPKENFCGGTTIWENHFITGTGIMLSKDSCHKLVNLGIIGTHLNDDVIIGVSLKFYLHLYFTYISDLNYSTKYCIDDSSSIATTNDENILYYRIKNQNREIDIDIFKMLCKEIYNITYDG